MIFIKDMQLGILLTATIKAQVRGGNFTIDERSEMYRSTLEYYAKVIGKDYPIIFLENSDYDLSGMKDALGDRLNIEWIQVPMSDVGIPYNSSKGKAYNEYLMIKEGVLRSTKLAQCTHFLKITGRYAMLNIRTMIKEIEKRAEDKLFMGDVKDTRLYEWIGSANFGHWGDSRYWVAQVRYYKEEMADCYKEMDESVEGCWAEHYLLKMGRRYRNDSRFIFRFRHQVLFNGITGMLTSADLATGKYRQDSIYNRCKAHVRHVMRILLPNFWF